MCMISPFSCTVPFFSLKVHVTKKFFLAYLKELSNEEEQNLFYCDSTLGCQVIQDFDLSKLEDL